MLKAFNVLPGFECAVPVENSHGNGLHVVPDTESVEDKHHQRKNEHHIKGGPVPLNLNELLSCDCAQCGIFHSVRCLAITETKISSRDGVISRMEVTPKFIRSPAA